MTVIPLKLRQDEGQRVEREMLSMLMQFTPANDLTLADAKFIAATARRLAWEAMEKLVEASA